MQLVDEQLEGSCSNLFPVSAWSDPAYPVADRPQRRRMLQASGCGSGHPRDLAPRSAPRRRPWPDARPAAAPECAAHSRNEMPWLSRPIGTGSSTIPSNQPTRERGRWFDRVILSARASAINGEAATAITLCIFTRVSVAARSVEPQSDRFDDRSPPRNFILDAAPSQDSNREQWKLAVI